VTGVIGWSRSLRDKRRRRWATDPQQILSAGTWIWPSIKGRRHGRSARRRQRDAAPGLQGPESRSAGDPHRSRLVPLVAELRAHERQAVKDLDQWKTHHEERKVIDASPAAITLALLLTDEELDCCLRGHATGDGGLWWNGAS
jgi:hypothetical protein